MVTQKEKYFRGVCRPRGFSDSLCSMVRRVLNVSFESPASNGLSGRPGENEFVSPGFFYPVSNGGGRSVSLIAFFGRSNVSLAGCVTLDNFDRRSLHMTRSGERIPVRTIGPFNKLAVSLLLIYSDDTPTTPWSPCAATQLEK